MLNLGLSFLCVVGTYKIYIVFVPWQILKLPLTLFKLVSVCVLIAYWFVQCVQILIWFVFQPRTVNAPDVGSVAILKTLFYPLLTHLSQLFLGILYFLCTMLFCGAW